MKIAIKSIVPNPEQPRKEIAPESLAELANSIRQHGLINPISVEEAGDHYILIDGERRWRACQMAGLEEIDASVRPGLNGSGQVQRLVLALVANVQRKNIGPIETAESFKKLLNLGFKPGDVAQVMGLHESSIYNYLSFLDLAPATQQLYKSGKLSNNPESVKALLQIQDTDLQTQIATIAADRKMSGVEISRTVSRMRLNTSFQKRKPAPSQGPYKPAQVWDDHWNMIAQAGVTVSDPKLRAAAESTCRSCVLYDVANKTTCKECPTVTLLRKLVGGEK